MKIFLTGCAGFIGFHVAQELLKRGDEVIGLDNVSPYYDPTLKEARLKMLDGKKGFSFVRGSILDRATVKKCMQGCDRVCHLAALAGVRYSFEHPEEYIATNINGFFEVIDEARMQKIPGIVYASSSSVYGGNDSPNPGEPVRNVYPINVRGRFPTHLDTFPGGLGPELLKSDFADLAKRCDKNPWELTPGDFAKVLSGEYEWSFGGNACGDAFLDRLAREFLLAREYRKDSEDADTQTRHFRGIILRTVLYELYPEYRDAHDEKDWNAAYDGEHAFTPQRKQRAKTSSESAEEE